MRMKRFNWWFLVGKTKLTPRSLIGAAGVKWKSEGGVTL
jgi:hypothetical protein